MIFGRLSIAVAVLLAHPVSAQELSDDQITTLACLEQIEDDDDWRGCLNLIFAPCADDAVGSEGHVNCLTGQREMWSASVEGLQGVVGEAITPAGNAELAELLGDWTGYVVQKCQEVARIRADSGAASARLGCEITEIVGLSSEMAACLEGRSTADYCTFKE